MQQSQGALVVVTAGRAKLVEHARLVPATSPMMAPVELREGLEFGGQTHVRGCGNHDLSQRITEQTVHRPAAMPGAKPGPLTARSAF